MCVDSTEICLDCQVVIALGVLFVVFMLLWIQFDCLLFAKSLRKAIYTNAGFELQLINCPNRFVITFIRTHDTDYLF